MTRHHLLDLLPPDAAGMSVFRKLIVPPKTYTFTSTRCENPFAVFCYADREARSPLLVPSRAERRIYISRRSIQRRSLANESDVEKLFREFDFQIVEPSVLTAAETVSMFANCEFIAGPHGSGLYNGVFSRQKIRAASKYRAASAVRPSRWARRPRRRSVTRHGARMRPR